MRRSDCALICAEKPPFEQRRNEMRKSQFHGGEYFPLIPQARKASIPRPAVCPDHASWFDHCLDKAPKALCRSIRHMLEANPSNSLRRFVMETDHAGLEVVQYIRETLKNKSVVPYFAVMCHMVRNHKRNGLQRAMKNRAGGYGSLHATLLTTPQPSARPPRSICSYTVGTQTHPANAIWPGIPRQPGEAPEKKVIIAYDINDYKTKEELTSNRLFSTVTSALRSYRDMTVIEKNRLGLEMIINASSSLLKLTSLKQFTAGVLTQLTSILGFEDNSLLVQTGNGSCGFAATGDQGNYKIIAGTGLYEKYLDHCVTDLEDDRVKESITRVLSSKRSVFNEKDVVCYFKTRNDIENILYLQSQQPLNPTDRNLIDIFLSNVAIAFDNLYHRENLTRLVAERTHALEQEKETVARAHKLLSKYVPPQLTERILADEIEEVWDYTRRRLTLFFSDIKDFTTVTEQMEPEDLAGLLNGYFTEMNDIANRYGGVVVDFTGDGLFVFFGAPDSTSDREHALNCVRMAMAMQRRMVELGKKMV